MNNEIVYPDSLIKFIRFCKDNNLYHYIKSKYNNINALNNAIKLLFVENYIIGIFNFIPSKYIEQYKIDEYYIKLCDLKWKEYAKDMIIDERKEKCDLFKSVYNATIGCKSLSTNNDLFYLDDLLFFHGYNYEMQ